MSVARTWFAPVSTGDQRAVSVVRIGCRGADWRERGFLEKPDDTELSRRRSTLRPWLSQPRMLVPTSPGFAGSSPR
jgi:hypothetical protein